MESRGPKSVCQKDHAPSGGDGGRSFHASSSFRWLPVVLGSCLCHSSSFASFFTWPPPLWECLPLFFLSEGHSSLDIRSTSVISDDLTWKCLTSYFQRPSCQIRSHSQVAGMGLGHIFVAATVQLYPPRTLSLG